MKENKILIFLDINCKKKFIIKSNTKEDSEIKIKKNIFNLKKIDKSIKSYELLKKNQKKNIIKKIKKFEKKYKKI